MSSIREFRQLEWANKYLESKGLSILYLCPRAGKCLTTIKVMRKLGTPKVLICYPNISIKTSWINDFEKWEYSNPNIEYTTFSSLKKVVNNVYDLIVIDEVHLCSQQNRIDLNHLSIQNKNMLGLTGTLTERTEKELYEDIGLKVIARYSYSQAVEEGVISDYEIRIVETPLDTIVKKEYKKKGKASLFRSEKQQFQFLGRIIDHFMSIGKDPFMMRLNRMRLIQSSIAKTNLTKKLLDKYKDSRVLVFCGLASVADSLGCPSYHSKNAEESLLKDFCEGKGNHLSCCKMLSQGITVNPIQFGIINYTDSNGENFGQKVSRFLNFEYSTPDKKAIIYVICSTEEIEKSWIRSAVEFLDPTKIKWNYQLSH